MSSAALPEETLKAIDFLHSLRDRFRRDGQKRDLTTCEQIEKHIIEPLKQIDYRTLSILPPSHVPAKELNAVNDTLGALDQFARENAEKGIIEGEIDRLELEIGEFDKALTTAVVRLEKEHVDLGRLHAENRRNRASVHIRGTLFEQTEESAIGKRAAARYGLDSGALSMRAVWQGRL